MEILACNSSSKNLKTIDIDSESAIYTGFKRVIPTLCRLICMRHFMTSNKAMLTELLLKTGRDIANRKDTPPKYQWASIEPEPTITTSFF